MISSEGSGTDMSKSRHCEAEMIGALKQLDAGRRGEDVAREMGVSKHNLRLESEVRLDGREPGAGSQTAG